MELVPEEELETSAIGGPNSNVDRRAKKVTVVYLYIETSGWMDLEAFNYSWVLIWITYTDCSV